MKKLRFLALLLVAAFVFSGCNIIKVNPERDGEQVVAEVNGEKIFKKDVYESAGITWDKKVESWEMDDYKQSKEDALDSLIQQEVVKQKINDTSLGYYTFTTDERKEIDDAVTKYKTDNYDKLLADYQEKAKTDPSIKPEEKANADIEQYKKDQEYQAAYTKAQKQVTDPVTPTEDDIKSTYDEILSYEKTQFDSDPSQISIFEMYYGYPILYYPQDGFVRVKQILISLPDDVKTEISELRKANKTDEANKKRDEELKKILDKATDELAKVKNANGDLTKLDTLIREYDKAEAANDESAESSTDEEQEIPDYLVYKDTKDWVQEFTDAALTLTDIGKPSELVATDYGYHILWLTEKIAKGDVPLDKAKDDVTEVAKSQKQNEAWSAKIQEWMTEYKSKIKEYRNRLHN